MVNSLASFIFYALAMVGIIAVGLLVAKSSLNVGYFNNRKNQFLSIESFLALEPRKNIYVLKAGSERFLVCTDTNGSHLLTKLDKDNLPSKEEMDDTVVPMNTPRMSQRPRPVSEKWLETPFVQNMMKSIQKSDMRNNSIKIQRDRRI